MEKARAERAKEEEEKEFLARLREHPNDDDTRLVYADWLEEHSQTAKSQFLRFQLKMRTMSPSDPKFDLIGAQFRNMASLLEPKWRAVVSYAPIEECKQPRSLRMDFPCPKQWSALEKGAAGEGDTVRYCGSCKQNVYFSHDLDEAYENARLGRCVAVDPVQFRVPDDLKNRLRVMSDAPPMLGTVVPLEEVSVSADEEKPSLFDRVRSFFRR